MATGVSRPGLRSGTNSDSAAHFAPVLASHARGREQVNAFKVGDRILYVLPRAPRNGRPNIVKLPGVVIGTSGERRVSIRLDNHRMHRNTVTDALEHETP